MGKVFMEELSKKLDLNSEKLIIVNRSGVPFFTVLGVVFIILKLTNVIAWSWWWVLAPIWIPVSITLLLIVLLLLLIIVASIFCKNALQVEVEVNDTTEENTKKEVPNKEFTSTTTEEVTITIEETPNSTIETSKEEPKKEDTKIEVQEKEKDTIKVNKVSTKKRRTKKKDNGTEQGTESVDNSQQSLEGSSVDNNTNISK